MSPPGHESVRLDNYAREIRAVLVECRRQGLPFPVAWTMARRVLAPTPGWMERWGDGGSVDPREERPIDFMRRHFMAAYNRTPAPKPPCQFAPSCRQPQVEDHPYCDKHAVGRLEAA